LPVQHILFDFDGTLIDSSGAILTTMAAVLSTNGLTPQRPLTRDLIGPPLLQTLQALTGSTDEVLLSALAAQFRQRYDSDGVAVTEAYAGVATVLQRLHDAGLQLYLATNKRQVPTLLLLERFGWLHYFAAVYCLDSRQPAFASKSQMLQMLLTEKNINASQAVYVGDTNHDEIAATAAGLPFFAVSWGYGVGSQAYSSTAVCANSPEQLAALLLAKS
jgi:phosphoglycolate phosphatase